MYLYNMPLTMINSIQIFGKFYLRSEVYKIGLVSFLYSQANITIYSFRMLISQLLPGDFLKT